MNVTLKKKSKANRVLNQVFVFAKAQFSAFVGGITDYLIMIFLTEIFHLHYTLSIAEGYRDWLNFVFQVFFIKLR